MNPAAKPVARVPKSNGVLAETTELSTLVVPQDWKRPAPTFGYGVLVVIR